MQHLRAALVHSHQWCLLQGIPGVGPARVVALLRIQNLAKNIKVLTHGLKEQARTIAIDAQFGVVGVGVDAGMIDKSPGYREA
ncbi:hypothetical protein D3C81_1749300 [compost metagenome]